MQLLTYIGTLIFVSLGLHSAALGQEFGISKYFLGSRKPEPCLNVSLTDSLAYMRFGDTLHLKLILRNCDTVPVYTWESGPRIELRRIPQRQCEFPGPDFNLVKQQFHPVVAGLGQPPKVRIDPGDTLTITADFVCPDCFLKNWIGDYTASIDIYCESAYGKQAEWVYSDNSVAVLVLPPRSK